MSQRQYLDQLFSYGVQALQNSDLQLARKTFQQILKEFPNHPDAHNLLGVVLAKMEMGEKALEQFNKAIDANSVNPNYYINRGLAYLKRSEAEPAIADFTKATELNPQSAEAFFNLGNAEKARGNTRGAVDHFTKVVQLQPGHAQALYNLGNLHLEAGNYKSAITLFERTLQVNPASARAHNNLGIALEEWEQWNEAEAHFKTSLRIDPEFSEAGKNLATLYEKQGKTEEAKSQFSHFLKTKSDPWQLLHAEMICPVIPKSNAEIDSCREKLNEVLDHYLAHPPEGDPDLIHKSGVEPPSMLIYQGRDDKALKQKFASFFTRYFPKNIPKDFATPGKRKIGFVVTAGHEGVFIKCMRGILDRLSRDKFEVWLICSQPNGERILRPVLGPDNIHYLTIPHQLQQAAQRISQARLDVLHYWEVGTDSMNYFLPYYRLAPVQCTSWGWPVTSGISNMDYFISSQGLETEGASEHYTEKLLRMNRLPVYYYPPPVPQKITERTQYGFSNDHNLYLCTQNLRKVHPDFDAIAGDILQLDTRGRILFIADKQEHITQLFRERITGANPRVANRITILNRMNEDEYLSLVSSVDVVLDTLHYGAGANTVYDAFACGTPVITLPGVFHRSRYASAACRQAGVTDGVAGSRDEYLSKAVTLATNREFSKHTGHIFEDAEAISELESLFENMVIP